MASGIMMSQRISFPRFLSQSCGEGSPDRHSGDSYSPTSESSPLALSGISANQYLTRKYGTTLKMAPPTYADQKNQSGKPKMKPISSASLPPPINHATPINTKV